MVAVGQIAALLPYVVGSGVGPPPGTSVAFDVVGSVPVAATVTVGADGKAAAVDGVAPGATVTLRMSTETLGRLAGGRVDPAAAEVEVEGDAELGRKVLAELAIAP